MNLYLVRHGQTDWNREGRVQGRADLPLNALGVAQSAALARHLTPVPLAAVYTSPAQRARQTAEAIAQAHGLEARPREGLLEMEMGALDGVSLREMRDRFPDFFVLWSADPGTARFPGGETMTELQERTWATALEIIRAHGPTESVVLVSHAFALYSILCRVLGMPLANYGRLRQEPGAVSLVVVRTQPNTDPAAGFWTLTLLNYTAHLDGVTAD